WAELSTLTCRERIPELRPTNTRVDGTEPMLRLDDLITLVDEWNLTHTHQVGLVIELKHTHFLRTHGHDLVELMLGTLERFEWDDKPDLLTIESFECGPLDRLREAGVKATLIFLLESTGAPADEVAVRGSTPRTYEWYRSNEGLDALAARVHGISLAKRDLLRVNGRGHATGTLDIVDRAHARGLSVFTWTLRPENRFLTPGFRRGRTAAAWGDWQAEWRLILSTGLDGVFLDHPDLLSYIATRAHQPG
ncbi:MAG: glycerophosphodiester phosphodiesterase, partial [Microbacteriaceae bacterium]|nr:glycerophosphodiester phosphodiesterase [Microbacteriaceae bacterium]